MEMIRGTSLFWRWMPNTPRGASGAMDFDDETFDTVVTSCVFCSVPDPVKGLKEIYRVLKPVGRLIMLEHVRSQHWLIGKLMDMINFIPLHLWGANINRNTVENVRKAGFRDIEVTYLRRDIFLMIIAKR